MFVYIFLFLFIFICLYIYIYIYIYILLDLRYVLDQICHVCNNKIMLIIIYFIVIFIGFI